ncbi:hypothetical protein SUDANB178_00187 [Streptomyces sp. enrichment culture]
MLPPPWNPLSTLAAVDVLSSARSAGLAELERVPHQETFALSTTAHSR